MLPNTTCAAKHDLTGRQRFRRTVPDDTDIDFPAFNIADAAISVGAALMIFDSLFASDDSDGQDRGTVAK